MNTQYAAAYNNLNGARRDYRFQTELSVFPSIVSDKTHVVRSDEFWMLNDILNIIPGTNKITFQQPVFLDKALRQNTPLSNYDTSQLIYNHAYYHNENSDAELTRYAAWALVKEIEKTTPTAFLQEYFINPSQPLEQISAKSQDAERIVLRNHVKKLAKHTNKIFYFLGATPMDFAKFNHQKTEWLFGSKTKRWIIQQYKLLPNIAHPKPGDLAAPPRTNLHDYMNNRLLTAYINAMEYIITKWQENPHLHTRPYFAELTYIAIHSIVTNFASNGTRPAANLCRTGIKTIEYHKKEREINFAKSYINKRIR